LAGRNRTSRTIVRWPAERSVVRAWSTTCTLPCVTSTATSVRPRVTLKAVPMARTATPDASTMKGRAGFFATVK
jgi:hypothetical protein